MEDVMSIQDDETLRLYVEESIEHLADIENDLLAIENDGADINEELVNKVFRAAHSIKGGAANLTAKCLGVDEADTLGLGHCFVCTSSPALPGTDSPVRPRRS